MEAFRMMGSMFFEFPEDEKIASKLIGAVPLHWMWFDGYLEIGASAVSADRIQKNTGFNISRFADSPIYVGAHDEQSANRLSANLEEILIKRKLPGFVEFDMAGFDRSFPFETTKILAAGFVSQGYRGWLTFYMSGYRNNRDENPARCTSARLPSTRGTSWVRTSSRWPSPSTPSQ